MAVQNRDPTPRGADVVWTGRGMNIPMLAIAVGLSGLGVALLVIPRDLAGIGVLLCGPLLAIWAIVRVTVSATSVIVRMGWLGWPRLTTQFDDVLSANVGYARPRRYGGWGLRGGRSLLVVLVRGGDALRLVKRDGTKFLVTVDNAAAAAAAVQAQLHRRSS